MTEDELRERGIDGGDEELIRLAKDIGVKYLDCSNDSLRKDLYETYCIYVRNGGPLRNIGPPLEDDPEPGCDNMQSSFAELRDAMNAAEWFRSRGRPRDAEERRGRARFIAAHRAWCSRHPDRTPELPEPIADDVPGKPSKKRKR